MKKWLLFAVIVFGGFLAFHFKENLLLHFLLHRMETVAQGALQATFSYEKAYVDEGKIVVHGAKIVREGDFSCALETLSFKPSFSLLSRSVGGALYVDGCLVNIDAPLEAMEWPKMPFLHLNLAIDVTRAHVGLPGECAIRARVCGGSIEGICLSDFLSTRFCLERGEWSLDCALNSCPMDAFSHLLHTFFAPLLPRELLEWKCISGQGDGAFSLLVREGALAAFRSDLLFTAAKVENCTLPVAAHLRLLAAKVDLDPQSGTWDGEFTLNEGRMTFLKEERALSGGLYLPASNLIVKEGRVESSSIEGTFLGMEGSLEIDWLSKSELLRMRFAGPAERVIALLPEKLQESFLNAFPEDTFSIDLKVRPGNEEVCLEGALTTTTPQLQSHTIEFGCHFRKEVGVEITPSSLPPVDAMIANFKDQLGFSGKRLGWVRGSNFPVEKFVSPFFLRPMGLAGSGRVNFEGIIDDHFLILFYKGDEIKVESPHFVLKADKIAEEIFPEIVAAHYIDLATFHHIGVLPLREASYRQKNYDLTFENISALVQFENNKIVMRQVDTAWDDLHFQGEIALEIKSPTDFDLTLKTNRIYGSLTTAEDFLSHIIPSTWWQLPLAGEVESGNDGLFFRFLFQPRSKLVEGHVRGVCKGGCEKELFSIADGEVAFEYDFKKNRLLFSEGTGSLNCVGSKKSHPFAATEVAFLRFPHPEVHIDCTVATDHFPLHILGMIKDEGEKTVLDFNGASCKLLGSLEKEHLVIDSFAYGDLEGSLQAHLNETFWEIEGMHVKSGDRLHFDWEGRVDLQEVALEGNISHLIIDLSEMSSSPTLGASTKEWMSSWKPRGKLLGQGVLRGSVQKGIEAIAEVSFHGLECGGIHCGDGEHLFCRYSTEDGLTVEGLEIELPTAQGGERYRLGKLQTHFESEKVIFEEFEFSLPPGKLPLMTEVLERLFPGKIHPDLLTKATTLKKEEPLVGSITVAAYPHTLSVYLTLKEGVYHLDQWEADLKRFSLAYDADQLKIATDLRMHDRWYGLELVTKSASLSSCHVVLSDPYCLDKLVATCHRNDLGNWIIERVSGGLPGLAVSLEGSQGHLQGEICFDGRELTYLLPADVRPFFEKLELGDGYRLSGEFFCPDLRTLAFHGMLMGENCLLKGLRIDALQAEVSWSPTSCIISDLMIADWAGRLSLPEAMIVKDEERWSLTIPSVEITNLRLSRLEKEEESETNMHGKAPFRSLFLSSLSVEGIHGILGDKESFVGTGRIHFTNAAKKTIVSNLLRIPTEITARIGLDLSLLVPVRGEVHYTIHDGKIFLTRFMNMYSEGKRSRFYLADGHNAYIDFEGNLNVKVKMKQYNLLMKLAEFFTVTVKGTLFKPTYTFLHVPEEVDAAEED